jgi:hypothetical protein
VTVPPWLTGPWVRTARSIDDGPPDECSDVVWLQVGPWFADLRLPRPGCAGTHAFDTAHAFSGRLEVIGSEGPGLRVAWHHDLDSIDPDGSHPGEPDSAVVQVRDGCLIESGPGYVEWWDRPRHPAAGPSADGWVLERAFGPDGPASTRVVCIDGMAVAVWAAPVPGGAWCSVTGGWEPARVVGVVPSDLDIGAALRTAAAGGTPDSGWIEQKER